MQTEPSRLTRRTLMATAAVIGAIGAGRAAGASGPPVASVRPVTETLHGTTVVDPYRWMETPSDPEWAPWLAGQDAYARQVLGAIPGRDALADTIAAVSSVGVAVSQVQAAGPFVFIERRPAGANTFKVYVREGADGTDRLLIDPDTRAKDGSHMSLDYWRASPDGALVAVGMSAAGSEDATLHVVETASGAMRADALERASQTVPAWLPDGSGLFITRQREGTRPGDLDRQLNSSAWLHRLGANASDDVKVMAQGLHPELPIAPVQIPTVVTQAGAAYVLGSPVNGDDIDVDLFVSPLADAAAGKPVWRQVCSRADQVAGPEGDFGAVVVGEDLYLLTRKDAPRYKIIKTPIANPSVATATVVLPEGEAVLNTIHAARDAVYIHAMQDGLGRLLRLARDGTVTRLSLPFEGSLSGPWSDPRQDGCWFGLSGWLRPEVICRALADGTVVATDIAPVPPLDLSRYESQEVLVTARDGTKVPLSIVYAKDVKRNGSAPLYLTAYGAYAISYTPAFVGRFLPWLDLGGVFAVAHVRGGGELGDAWHRAGQMLTKPNTWRDCIDCARWLIAEGWTSSAKLAVEGTSAGGIMVSRFLTEAPELLAVALIRVGVSNALRVEFSENGPPNVFEFGTVSDADGFRGLLEMDGYQHVKDGTAYPSVMLTAGAHDPRVAPWEAGKMTARLQAATSSGKPVIFRVEQDAGHGVGSTRSQRDLETADTYAFILSETGDGRFRRG